ncbi:hypothetical protein [Victivallis vadensis]|uniref:hypothetical protein n=1 Tax=Victivallis vadensis TaxID=172901 RepID=UPI001401F266|nr:hypothetical protein [Victivallis vadensis]
MNSMRRRPATSPHYKQELTGAKPVPLAEACEPAVKKPGKWESSEHIARQNF